MHSRIFQISTKPIGEDDYITESDYYDHWFTHQIADYVSDDSNRDEDIDWLKEYSNGFDIFRDNNGNYTIIVNNKEKYFENAYDRFLRELDRIGRPTLEQFSQRIDLWSLNDACEDKYGFYVEYCDDDNGHDLITLDDFIRRCDACTTYYLGGTIDYHY